ncbi:hypothetical protein Mal15_05180 [Stieleria maiorica]|uniref:DUF4139 domain-containing protein n=1 Tax=Stieleria maiorica TaxID=2795974 RepID=A0A5B9M8Y7_9BACT|nr:DUF4139 domain-containing protein [Stieleria maiorica]QEF96490.1 hypothetical protein Mal15_05180 [Stieleria maiorica]
MQAIIGFLRTAVLLRTIVFASSVSMLLASVSASAQESASLVEVDSPIAAVTVFRHQANVVRAIEVQPSNAPQRIRVTGLPRTIHDQSVRWETDAEITVRSLRVTPHQIKVDQAAKKAWAEEIAKQNLAIQDAAHEVAVIEQDLETIEDLEEFTAAKTNKGLGESKLEVESVTAIADFVMQRRRMLAKELHGARQELQSLQDQLDASIQKAQRESESRPEATFDAVLMVDSPRGGTLRLSYWVDEVSWQPQYSIHATSGRQGEDSFVAQLDGTVTQNSGEDWRGVQLAFCTGVPNLQAATPLLVPLRVSVNQATGDGDGSGGYSNTGSSAGDAPAWEDPAVWQRNLALNTEAAGRQVGEINRRQSVQRELADDASTNLADETYRVATPIDVADQTAEQAITILRWEITSPIYRVVTPLLSSFAYREAALENQLGQSLVGGEATVFLDGRFVGRTTLPPTATGGEFAIGLGADRQVRTRRELLSRDESIQGGNRLSRLEYRLVINNYHNDEIDIRLYDRIPITSDSGTVNVVTDSGSLGQLSGDAKYLRMQRPTGILRWDLTIPAKRFGSNAYDHHYHYTIEMDRTQSIISNDVVQQMQNDLRFNQSGGGGMGGGMGGFGGGSF